MPNTELVTSDVTPEGQDGCPEGPPNPGWGSLYS